jgi:hypothetical protein
MVRVLDLEGVSTAMRSVSRGAPSPDLLRWVSEEPGDTSKSKLTLNGLEGTLLAATATAISPSASMTRRAGARLAQLGCAPGDVKEFKDGGGARCSHGTSLSGSDGYTIEVLKRLAATSGATRGAMCSSAGGGTGSQSEHAIYSEDDVG